MADLSKIKLNGTEYNIKDAYIRSILNNKQDKAIFVQYITQDGGNTFTCNKTYSEIIAVSQTDLIIGQLIFLDQDQVIQEAIQMDSIRVHADVIEWSFLTVGDSAENNWIAEITHNENNNITLHSAVNGMPLVIYTVSADELINSTYTNNITCNYTVEALWGMIQNREKFFPILAFIDNNIFIGAKQLTVNYIMEDNLRLDSISSTTGTDISVIQIDHNNNSIFLRTYNAPSLKITSKFPEQWADNEQLWLIEEPTLYYGIEIMPFNFIKCSSLPEENIIPITTDNESFTVYYISSNNIQGYVPSEIASQYNFEPGWYTLQQLLALFSQINSSNAEYVGVVSDYSELMAESTGEPHDNYGLVIYHNFYIHENGNKYLYLGGPAIQPGEGKNSIIINGNRDTATGDFSLVNGAKNAASGKYSHAEGYMTSASGYASHAEGSESGAYGHGSHGEGWSWAYGDMSHSEGQCTWASGDISHSEGEGTIAHGKAQHVAGRYNIPEIVQDETDYGVYAEIIGNGNSTTCSNARTLDWQGNEILAGKLTVGIAPTNNMDVTTKQYVDNAITTAINNNHSPVVIWETNGTGLLALGADITTTPAWQLTNLDFSPFKRVKIYAKPGQKTSGIGTDASVTPAAILEMSLDSRAAGPVGGHYIGSVVGQKPNDANRLFTLTCAISADKTSFAVLRMTSLYGTAATSNTDVDGYVFKIEGYYDAENSSGGQGGSGGSSQPVDINDLPLASTTSNGLMSATDKTVLDNLNPNVSVTYSNVNSSTMAIMNAKQENLVDLLINEQPHILAQIRTNNLLNVNDEEVTDGYLSSSGVLTASTNNNDYVGPFIPVTVGQDIYYTGIVGETTSSSINRRLHVFNANKQWIKQISFAGSLRVGDHWSTHGTVPANGAYVRVSWGITDYNVMISVGAPNGYEPYYLTPFEEITSASFQLASNSDMTGAVTYTTTVPSTITDAYGFKYNPILGKIYLTTGHIASYNGETLPGYWWSDRDIYEAGHSPSTGAEVIYMLADEDIEEYSYTPLIIPMFYQKNYFVINNGEIINITYYAETLAAKHFTVYDGVKIGATDIDETNVIGWNHAADEIDLKAPINSPVFTGSPQAPTPNVNVNSERIATTAFVQTKMGNIAPIESGKASKNYNIGEYLMLGGYLFKTTTSISSGTTFTSGTNIERTTVADELLYLLSLIQGGD